MIKYILSPAKTLKIKTTDKQSSLPQPHSLNKKILKNLTLLNPTQLMEVFSISSKLANQLHYALKNKTFHPAIFYYMGEAFKSLDVGSMNDTQIQYLQECVYIYSACYGLLKPLDAIQYYRFDFTVSAEKLNIKNAHRIIKKDVTQTLKKQNSEIIVLICSQEYKNMIDLDSLRSHKHIIDTSFISVYHDLEKVVSVHAKQARGLFLKTCVHHSITTLDDLLSIVSFDGWVLDHTLSTNTHRVFKKDF